MHNAPGQMHNHWCSYDSTDPVRVWEIAAPLPQPSSTSTSTSPQRAFVAAVLAAAKDTGVVIVDDGDVDAALTRHARVGAPTEWLPFEDALFGGAAVPFTSQVFVRDAAGHVVSTVAADAGALLRALEPRLDDAYLRRFAASHPFVGVFSTSTAKQVRVSFCFFSSLPFDATDSALHEKNQAALLALRERLVALARAHGGSVDAKT